MVYLKEEQVILLQQFMDYFRNDPSLYDVIRGMFVKDDSQPTLEGLLQYAERYARTQHGLTDGSWKGETPLLEVTLAIRVKQEKRTT